MQINVNNVAKVEVKHTVLVNDGRPPCAVTYLHVLTPDGEAVKIVLFPPLDNEQRGTAPQVVEAGEEYPDDFS